MICFRSLQNWYLQQQPKFYHFSVLCCDLLSFFAKLIFTTTASRNKRRLGRLWFAFVLCKTDIYNNWATKRNKRQLVVICFRSLQNWYLQQLTQSLSGGWFSCDLLSFFAKLIFTTTTYLNNSTACRLWFAFVLCKTDIYNNILRFWINRNRVVICFRSLQNWYLQQR